MTGLREKVVLYWHRTTNNPSVCAGDRAIIESIHPGPVKTEAPPAIKSKLMRGEGNPMKQAFVVDVTVETVGGKSALYKVTAIHDILTLE